jgi:hypothetical protein
LKQIRRNSFSKFIYDTLLFKYEHIKPANISYLNILNQIRNKYGYEIEFINPQDIYINGIGGNGLIELIKGRTVVLLGQWILMKRKELEVLIDSKNRRFFNPIPILLSSRFFFF